MTLEILNNLGQLHHTNNKSLFACTSLYITNLMQTSCEQEDKLKLKEVKQDKTCTLIGLVTMAIINN